MQASSQPNIWGVVLRRLWTRVVQGYVSQGPKGRERGEVVGEGAAIPLPTS